MIEDNDLHRALGRVEGAIEQLGISLAEHRREASELRGVIIKHMRDQARLNASTDAALTYLKVTVDRIRKPIDTLISLRNLIIGAAALLAAVGAIFANVPQAIWGFFVHQR
jgi:hypothetical protein